MAQPPPEDRARDQGDVEMPPISGIRRLQRALSDLELTSAVGGSALLASLGLTNQVRDWDLVVDTSPHAVTEVLQELGVKPQRMERTGIYRTEAAYTTTIDSAPIDILVNFALLADDGAVVPIPARAGHIWQGLIMARPEDWVTAYVLMGRDDKAGLLRHGR